MSCYPCISSRGAFDFDFGLGTVVVQLVPLTMLSFLICDATIFLFDPHSSSVVHRDLIWTLPIGYQYIAEFTLTTFLDRNPSDGG